MSAWLQCSHSGAWEPGNEATTHCEKDTKAYVERVSVSEWGFKRLTECKNMVVSQDTILGITSCCSLALIDFTTDFTSILVLILCFLCQSPSFFFLALPLTLLQWDHYHAAVLGTMNLHKCTQVFVNRITHVQWWICYTLLFCQHFNCNYVSGSYALLKTGKQGQKELLPVSCLLIIVVQQQEARK